MPTPKPFCWIAFLLLAWPLFPPPGFRRLFLPFLFITSLVSVRLRTAPSKHIRQPAKTTTTCRCNLATSSHPAGSWLGCSRHRFVASNSVHSLSNSWSDRASALSGPVRVPEELYCYDFDDKCRWRNMEGLLVDELDWYQGGGTLDENRLKYEWVRGRAD